MLTVVYYEQAVPDEQARARKWREFAQRLKIPIVTDPRLEAERRRRALAVVRSEFGGG